MHEDTSVLARSWAVVSELRTAWPFRLIFVPPTFKLLATLLPLPAFLHALGSMHESSKCLAFWVFSYGHQLHSPCRHPVLSGAIFLEGVQ